MRDDLQPPDFGGRRVGEGGEEWRGSFVNFCQLTGGPFCQLTGGVSCQLTGGPFCHLAGPPIPSNATKRKRTVIVISAICVSTVIIISTCINSNISISIMQCLWPLGVLWKFQSVCSNGPHPYKVDTEYLDVLDISYRGHMRSSLCRLVWRRLVWPPCWPHASALAARGATDTRPGFSVEMACAVRTCRGIAVARR